MNILILFRKDGIYTGAWSFEVLANKYALDILVNSIEEQFNLLNKVKIEYDANKYDIKSKSCYNDDGSYNIVVGVKDYCNNEKLTDKQYNHICNTILHELIHARNHSLLTDGTKNLLKNNIMTLAHYAWKMLDEYSAYLEANQRFPETADELKGDIDTFFYAFTHMTRGTLIGGTDWQFYDAFYDYCSALVVTYILDKDNLLSYNDGKNKDMIESYIDDLKYSYGKMPLSYKQYEHLGKRLIKDILIIIPKEKQKVFMYNTHIIELK